MRRALLIAWIVCLLAMPAAWAFSATKSAPKEKARAATTERSSADHKADSQKADDEKVAKEKAAKDKADKTASDKKAEAAKKAQAPKPKKASVVRLTIKGELPENTSAAGLFGELQTSLRTVVQRLQEAADDASVAAVWLRIEDLEVGRGKVFELRDAVARFRKSHKPIYAELTSADSSQYLLAAACDEVFMPPSGMLLVPGVRAEMTFYKGLFDKLGVQFDVLQQGKFKGAGEPYSRTHMSPALRESMEAVVNDIYGDLTRTIAKDRKLQDYQVKSLVDQGLFTATAARKAGLVDQLLYADEFEDALRKRLKADEINVISNYKKKQIDTDFSGLSGLMKLMELMFGGGKQSERVSQQKKIAVVYAVGPIVEGKGSAGLFDEEVVGSASLCHALRTAADDPKVVAVVLRIDSPGGSAVASDLIWREVVRMKKPVIASMSDVAGSGGYYIAMGAQKIIAAPGTITGSIGVIGGKLVIGKLLDKIGVTTDVISRGKNSGSLSSTQPFTPSEREAWKEMMEETYGQFVGKAAAGRKMSREKLEQLAQGRIYTGHMAVANGLVDRLGTLHDAIAEAKKAAHLKAGEKVELLILPRAKTFFEQLFGDPSAASDLDTLLPDLGRTLRQVALWTRLFSEPTLTLMPCQVRVK